MHCSKTPGKYVSKIKLLSDELQESNIHSIFLKPNNQL
jgi:hypothetical protein